MSRVDDLIAEHCPDGVVFKQLGEIGEFIRGSGLQKSDLTEHGVPAIHYGQLHTHYGIWTDTTRSFTDPALAARLRRARPGDLIIVTTSEDDAAVAKATAWVGDSEVAVSGDAYIYRHSLDPRFAAYFFHSDHLRAQKAPHISGTKVRRISGTSLAKIRIPVPPLEVQREIVRVLDTFTALEAELEAELEARRIQYEHYKSALLAARGSEESVAIADHIVYVRGLTYSKADEVNSSSDGFAVLRSNNIELGTNRLNFDDVRFVGHSVRTRQDQWLRRDDILLSAGSGSKAHVGKAAFIANDMDYTFGGFMAVVRANGQILPRYLYHHLTSARFRDYLDATIASTTINNLTRSIVGAFEVPLVDVGEQERIASLLDAFDGLTNDLAIGLPAELAARRKQYEYYRDRLLTFEEAVA